MLLQTMSAADKLGEVVFSFVLSKFFFISFPLSYFRSSGHGYVKMGMTHNYFESNYSEY